MPERSVKVYLEDIKQAILMIEQYTANFTMADFINDRKTCDAVIRNLEIIGEAAKNLLRLDQNAYPEVPWQEIIGLRNKVAHEYFGIDLDNIWKTVTDDLPLLKEQLAKEA